MKKKHLIVSIIIGFLFFISYQVYKIFFYEPNTVMVTSVSSDGNYAVTSDTDNRIILWNLKKHKAKIISNDANIYSAYFIKHTDKFIWQDLKQDEVCLEDVHGNIIKQFKPGFPSYGEVMTTDLQYYIASNDNWNVFVERHGQIKRMLKEDSGGFLGAGKLINLILMSDDQYVLTAGIGSATVAKDGTIGRDIDDITRWNYKTGTRLIQYTGNAGKEVAAISPDDQYVVGADEGLGGYAWTLKSGKRVAHLDNIVLGHIINPKASIAEQRFSKKGLIPQPTNYGWRIDMPSYDPIKDGFAILAVKFIDNDHYLQFPTYTPWAILYKVTSNQPTKYINLGKNPYPSVVDYSADESIDTSPSAHVLVTGQYDADGIIEYQYDPKTQNLTRVWAPSAPSFLAKWFWVSK